MPSYWDLDAWRKYGISDNMIFDANGQTRPGWHRTDRGYESDYYPGGPGDPIADSPPPAAPPGGGGAWGGDYGGFSGGPEYQSPEWISPGDFDPGPAFSYKDFIAPDPANVGKDPAFQFRFDQGLKALGATRAGRGTFLSGETGKAMQDYGQNAASQEYNNIWNRSLSEYDTNRNNAFGMWASQYGQRKDSYGFKQQNVFNQNAFNQTSARDRWNALFSNWSKTGDWLSSVASGGD